MFQVVQQDIQVLLIMSVVPAKVAGVKRIVVVSPPNSSGNIDPLTIVAADLCGATEIYKTGGVQSIAALTYGTRSIKKVNKIVGPGGAFVTLAKYLVSNIVSIDMMAGPTELGIVIDSATDIDVAVWILFHKQNTLQIHFVMH